MGDYLEQQQFELEILESIFTNELTVLSNQLPISYKIIITTNLNSYQVENATLTCMFTLPFNYPDVVPEIELTDASENVSCEQLEDLTNFLQKTAEENVGTVMTHTLITALQEKLAQMLEEGAEERSRIEDERKKVLEEAETKRLEGTKVTVESFLVWKEKFESEFVVPKFITPSNNKLSGKELFMRDHQMDTSDIAMLDDGSVVVEVDESLFEDFEEVEEVDEDFND